METEAGSANEKASWLVEPKHQPLNRKPWTRALVLCLLLASTLSYLGWRQSGPPPNAFGLTPCEDDKELDCGFIHVPRDHHDATAGWVKLAVVRLSTPDRSARKGTVFLGAGGPGGSGAEMAVALAKGISQLFLGQFDIVGFDIRGVGQTLPTVTCFPTYDVGQLLARGTPLELGFDLPPGDPSQPETKAIIERQFRDWLALKKTEFELCEAQPHAAEMKYMSTTTNARDIAYLADLFDGKGAPINYIGFSYGSILGAYLVNMFPERAGRVAVDGIADAYDWANVPAYKWLYSWLNATEDTFKALVHACAEAGPSHCALAKKDGETGPDILARIDTFLDELYAHPLPVHNVSRPGILTSGAARAWTYLANNMPANFPVIAEWVAQAMEGDGSKLFERVRRRLVPVPRPGDHARSIIPCMDAVPFDGVDARELTEESSRVLRDVSPRWGLSISLWEPDGACEFLKSARLPRERFAGPFNHSLAHPILIANGDLDPITPLTSARRLHERHGSSARLVVQNNSPAHTTFFFGPSLCVGKAYRAYFTGDKHALPSETQCDSDYSIFPTKSGAARLDEDEEELKKLVRDLGDAFYDWIGRF